MQKQTCLDGFPIFFSIKTLQCVIYANFNIIQFLNQILKISCIVPLTLSNLKYFVYGPFNSIKFEIFQKRSWARLRRSGLALLEPGCSTQPLMILM